jgi:cell wall-associated NlpC family hydrolase
MSVDALLYDGGRNLGRGLLAGAIALVSFLALAVSLPVLVLAIVVGGLLGIPAATSALLPSAPVALPASLQPVASSAAQASLANRAAGPPIADTPAAIDIARRYLGVRYVFGGTDPATGLDCSGLVQLVFRQLGITLPRTAQQQYNATTRLTQDQLQPGDLVFFARTYDDPHDWVTHVGIYVGNGQQINAPTEGQVVSIQPVFTGFWGAHFVGGGRVGSR